MKTKASHLITCLTQRPRLSDGHCLCNPADTPPFPVSLEKRSSINHTQQAQLRRATMHTTTASHILVAQAHTNRYAPPLCSKGLLFMAVAGCLSLAFLAPAIAADFSGSLKGVSITDAQAINKPPVANFTHSINGDTVTFTAGGSYDSDGTISKYSWNFGDGSLGEGVSVSHQYSPLATAAVTLTIVDDKNGVAIAQQTIAKSEPKWLGATTGTSTWSLIYADSQETSSENGAATNAFDNNPSTIWHTAWSTSSPPPPHEIQIDLNKTYTFIGVRYLPRQVGTNGNVCNYEFYVSTDKNNWGTPVSTGTFENSSTLKEAAFTSTTGRYVRFRATRECNNNSWTTMAEIDFQGI